MDVIKGISKFYIGDSEETALAEMGFIINEDDVIVIEHTKVSDELGGKGVGKLILKDLVDWARKENKKIKPVCPYAVAQMEKNVEYHNLLVR